MAEDLDSTIRDNAAGPAEAQGDAVRMAQHSLPGQTRLRCSPPGQVAADKYLAGNASARTG